MGFKFKKPAIVIILVIICTTISTGASIYSYGKENQLVNVDGVIVLGAAVWDDKPSPVFKERIDHGIWLYENGYVDKIIFTGGKSVEDQLAESTVAKKYAEERAIPSEDILIETESKVTQENLLYASKIAKENNMESFIIVSDPLHMKRSMLMAKDYGLEAYSSPTPTTRYRTWKSKLSFLARETYYYSGYLIYRMFLRR